MPALRHQAKAADWLVLAALWAICLLHAAPALAANDTEAAVGNPLVVTFTHRLGKHEALRRVKAGVEEIKKTYGGLLFSVQELTWTDYHLRFRVAVLGFAASGGIEVTDHHVELRAHLPWLLAPLAEAAVPAIRREGQRILEKR